MVKVVTGKVRLSYPNLFKAKAFTPGMDAKYSAVLLIPKTEKETVAKITAAIREASEEWAEKFGKGKAPKNLRSPLRDGDVEKADEHPEYKGMWFISASSKNAPKLYDREGNDILDDQELYPGCWVRCDLNMAPYSNTGNNGVGAYLNSVKFWKDGERLAGYSASASAYDDDYEDDDDDMM